MKNFIGKVATLVGIIANIVLFVVTVVSIVFTIINDQILNLISEYINNRIFWLGTILSCSVIIYSLVISIIGVIKLIKGKNLKKIISINLIVLLSLIVASGIVVFGLAGLSSLTFDLYLGLYISYSVINMFFITGVLLNYK